MQSHPISAEAIILGANSLVAPHLFGLLGERGGRGLCLSRSDPRWPRPAGFEWRRFDAEHPQGPPFPAGSVLYSLLPLWLLPPVLPLAAACRQVIAFGSTSVFSKQASADPDERRLASRLAEAEARFTAACDAAGLPWTLFRPTLVYDGVSDRNITALARALLRLPLFPLAAPASGLRQPIHARELALAARAAAGDARLFRRALDLPGGETLTYRQMVERICVGLGHHPRLLPLPPALLRGGFRLLRRLPGLSRYSPELFTRMNEDLAFDGSEARALLDLPPTPFRPEFPWRGPAAR